MNVRALGALSIAVSLLAGCAASQPESTLPAEESVSMTKTQQAVALLESLETGDQEPVSFINPDKYIQHNLAVGDGLDGFAAIVAMKPPSGFKVRVIRAFEDGDYVFTHTEYDFFGPKIGFDVFRFEDGRIVEHWDNLIETAPPNPSGHTQIDGPTEATDLDKTEANKQLVRSFYQSVLVDGKMDEIGRYIVDDNYTQHNPQIADGISGLATAIEALAKQGLVMKFDKIHRVLGQGNFVLVMAEGSFGEKPYAYYDLFRVEDTKIVEHWDVMAEIPPSSEWKNTNGKF